jgi:hypothetical protein
MSEHAHAHDEHHHHEMPTSGRALDGVAISATLHCLTGCAIGEILGMVIGTALGFSNFQTIVLAVVLAFFFGYALTSLPLLRAGLAFSAVVPIALASDTFSIATMEIVDNGIMLAIPGAMHAGVDSALFWGALSVALVIAGFIAFPVNRWLIKRGKGHVAVHNTGIHGGPPVRVVGAIAAVAAVFGTVVLVAEAFDDDGAGHGGGHETAAAADPVRGLAVADDGLTLQLEEDTHARGRSQNLTFVIADDEGRPVRDYEVEHEKRMHLIVARRDLSEFQHLHPTVDGDGRWTTPLKLEDAGDYRVFADFKREGENHTLAADLFVDGQVDWAELPPPADTADAGDGYEVRLTAPDSHAGSEAELDFEIHRDGEPVKVEPYLGAGGHLVALREGDLAYLHVHPTGDAPADGAHAEAGAHGSEEHGGGATPVSFATEFPTAARYRLFLQFKHDGEVRTAAFTREVAR